MNILFLTFYFEPDLCAGSFRNTPLFRELQSRIGKDDYIHVITTEPNRYKTFEASGKAHEEGENYRIDRIKVPVHASGMVDQAKSFYVYFKNALKMVKGEKFDLVYASSSRLFTAFLGRICANKNGCPLYLDIRDIFVDSMRNAFRGNKFISIFIIPVLNLIERFTFKNASHINLVSEGFNYYFGKYKRPTYSYYTNGIDDIFLESGKESVPSGKKPYTVTYAGNIGKGQGLEKIIPELASRLGNDYHFRIIGDGGTRNVLEEVIKSRNLSNVELIPPVKRSELVEYYRQTSFFFFHLNVEKHLDYVLPSKMFEYGAFDKPIIAGVGGYAKQFVENYIPNHLLFNPADVDEIEKQLRSYVYTQEERVAFKEKFSRRKIMERMADDIIRFVKLT